MTAFDIVSWCSLVFGCAVFVLGIPASIYFGFRAERRRKEHAPPDVFDAIDTVLSAGANIATHDSSRRYRNLDRR